jgi:hypothetical protein
MEKILIDPSLFDFDDDFEEFALAIEKITGGKAKVSTMYALEIEDPKIARCVTVFIGTLKHLKKPAPAKPAQKAKEEKKVEKGPKEWRNKPRKQILYTFIDGERAGVEVRGPVLHLMIKQGKISDGTRLSHPKKGELMVVGNGANAHLVQVTHAEWTVAIPKPEPAAVPA